MRYISYRFCGKRSVQVRSDFNQPAAAAGECYLGTESGFKFVWVIDHRYHALCDGSIGTKEIKK